MEPRSLCGPGSSTTCSTSPRGVVTTLADPQRRQIVTDFVPTEPRVFPVGRLDADTEGLLLLTNDGDLAHRLTHPSYGVEKEYLAEVAGRPSAAAVRQLREGVELEDGMTAPAKVALSPPNLLRITIHEGRNRQVRRMCEAIGHPVRRLVRVRIGSITDRRLKPRHVARSHAHRGAGFGIRRRVGRRLACPAVSAEVRALRGATTLDRDDVDHMRERVHALLDELFSRNSLTNDDVISILLTATPDIRSGYPATAARLWGLSDVPLIGAQEIDVPSGLKLCIRLMAHVSTDRPRSDMRHVFLEGAKVLRSDLDD